MTKRDIRRKGAARSETAVPAAPVTGTAAPVADSVMFFVVSALALAVVGVVLLRGAHPAAIGLIVFTLLAAGLVGLAVVGVLGPLAGLVRETGPTIGGRARAALERDKSLTLRAIKELEFDRAMGKVSEPDFVEMRDRLRHRAMRLMRQLEGGGFYRQLIERDVASRVGEAAAPVPAPQRSDACPDCGTPHDADARFCKSCGRRLEQPAGEPV